MAPALIRFQCSCGKRLAAPVRYAGRSTKCPKCDSHVVVPESRVDDSVAAKLEPTFAGASHPKLEEFHRLLADRFADRLLEHGVKDGCPVLRFVIPQDRQQDIRLTIDADADQQILVIGSEIGTIMTLQEMTTALKMNRHLVASRLYLDDRDVLLLEYRAPLDGRTEAEAVSAVEEIANRADELEERLFLVDLR